MSSPQSTSTTTLAGEARLARSSDILVIGAGAAGMFAACWAGRTAATAAQPLTITALDTARKLGAKILVAGGGRCNVTHERVAEADYAGSSPPAIRKVLRRYTVDDTIAFFTAAGVELKTEDTGKLFPTSDSARTVLDALVREATRAGVRLIHPARVTALVKDSAGFRATSEAGEFAARRVILCTGGKSLPKSGSDGTGLELAKSLGHSITSPLVPALVPLVLPAGHWITALSGLTLPAAVTLASAGGKRLFSTTGSTLCTHVGLSGPAILDASRHWLVGRAADPAVALTLNWLPGEAPESLDRLLVDQQRRGALAVLRDRLPDRLARALCEQAAAPPTGDLSRDVRKRLATFVTATPLEITGDRGFAVAEATAGGVPLAEVRLETMESRVCPELYLAGEVLDVDGRIGGFNFQWAWASGFVAGRAAAAAAAGAGSPATTS
jgi:predicted Rossmann fold flavoprotein